MIICSGAATAFAEELVFSPAVILGIAGSDADLSDDGHTLYYSYNRKIWYVTKTAAVDPWNPLPPEPWSAPTIIPVSTNKSGSTSISSDELTLYYQAEDPNGYGGEDIWKLTRPDKYSNWGLSENIGSPVNTNRGEGAPEISSDGLTLFYNYVNGTADLWYSRRPNTNSAWGTPQLLTDLASHAWQGDPSISSDGLILVFASTRPGGFGKMDLWYSTRSSINDPWSEPVNAGPNVNTSADEAHPEISLSNSKVSFDRRGQSPLYCTKFIREVMEPVLDARIHPPWYDTTKDANHCFNIILKTDQPLPISGGEMVSVSIDVNGDGIFENDEKFSAGIEKVNGGKRMQHIYVKVFLGNAVQNNNPGVAIWKVGEHKIGYAEPDGTTPKYRIDDLTLQTY